MRRSGNDAHLLHGRTEAHAHHGDSGGLDQTGLLIHGIVRVFSTYNDEELPVALGCPAPRLTGEKVCAGKLQRAAQFTRLAGLQSALAETLDRGLSVLFGLDGTEKKFNPDIWTVLGQAKTVGGGSDVHLIDQSGEEGPDLLEVCRRHATVHQEEDVCKPLLQGWKKPKSSERTCVMEQTF